MKSAINNTVKFILIFFSFQYSVFAAGDEPCSATPLTTSATCTYSVQDNNGATASVGITAPGCSNYSNNDVWFSIVVPASGNVQVDTQTGSITDGGIAFYTGATCSALTLLSCDDDSSPNGLMPLLVATGLTPGSTLYVRFWKYAGGSGTFSICASTFSSPLNDNPANATTVLCGATCTTVSSTFLGATQTLAGCTGNANDDVWFSFVASQSSVVITVNPVTGIDPVVELFSGIPSSLISMTCDDVSFPSGTSGSGQFNGLTTGQLYYYRVYGVSSNIPNTINSPFTTCVFNAPPPPINDNCAGSIIITSGVNCSSVSGTVYGATQSQVGCLGNANDDVWFSFVATDASQLISVTPVSGFDPVVELFSGNCGSLTSISCNNTSYPSGAIGNALFSGLIVGQTYYYRVYQYSSLLPTVANASFTTCVSNAPSLPSNDECTNSMNITVGSSCNPTTGLIYGATQSLASGCGSVTSVYDVWFSFVATNQYQNITASLNNNTSVNLQVYSGSCTNLTSIYCGTLSSPTSFSTLDNLTPGQTYYYRIYPNSSIYPINTLSFSTCVTTAIPNTQDCLGAIPLCQNVYTTTTAYSGVGNFNNEINGSSGCLISGEKNDVWYTFNVITSGNLSFTITPTVSTNDYDWAVYNLTNANCSDINDNAALQVSCNFSGMSGPTGPNGMTGLQYSPVIPVTAGQTYMINVSQYSTSSNGYTINFSASTATIFDNIAPVFQSVSAMSCGASGITATFSENVLCSTVSVADFTLVGPDGNHSVTNISGTGCSLGGTMENTYSVSFSPPLTVSGNYTFSLVTGAGSVSDLCGNVAAPQSFNFTISVPNLNTNLDQNVSCFGGNDGSATSTVSGGTTPYSYAWNLNGSTVQTSQNAANLSAGTYQVIVTDATGCKDTSNVAINAPTKLTLSAIITDLNCGTNGQITTSVSGGTSSYTYSWSPIVNSTSSLTNIASSGNYSVHITDNNGCVLDSTFTVSGQTQFSNTITPISNQCLTGNVFNFSSTTSLSMSPGYSYSWDFGDGSALNTSSSPSHTYANAGNFTVTLITTSGVCSVTSSIQIEVYSIPTLTITANTPCEGSLLNISSTASGMQSYGWSGPNSTLSGQNPTIPNASLTDAGTYTLTVVDANGCSNSSSVNVTINSNPIPTFSVNSPCVGNSLNFTALPVGMNNYAWSGPTSLSGQNPSIASSTISNAGIYTLTVTDVNGCSATVNQNVVVNSLPVVSLTANQPCEGSILTINCSASNMTNYSWTGPSILSGQNPTILNVSQANAGTYNLTVTDANGCQNSANISVVVSPLPQPTASANTPCVGSSLNLTSLPAGMSNYSWTGPLTLSGQNPSVSSAQLSNSGTYTLTVTDVNGCQNSTTVTVLVNSNPTPTFTSNSPCVGASLNFTALPNGMTNYSWTGPTSLSGQNPLITTSSIGNSGIYSLSVTDANGCSGTVTNQVLVHNLPVAVATSNIPCEGTTLQLNGLPNGMQQYYWSGPMSFTTQNASVNNVNLTAAGKYTLTITDNNGCRDSASVQVIVNSIPIVDLSADRTQGCPPFSSVFTSTATNVQSYVWNFGNGQTSNVANPSVEYTQSGIYDVSLVLTNLNGCQSVVSIPAFIQVFEEPSASFLVNKVGGEESTVINLENNSSDDAINHLWNFGDGTPIVNQFEPSHEYIESGKTYSIQLTVENANGCKSSTSQLIEIKDPLLFYIPNSFTPDGDMYNQHFKPVFTSGVDLQGYSFTIFNRWGELIFESHDMEIGWDGTYGGKLVQDGLYVYSIEFGLKADDGRKRIEGNINLLK